MENAGGDYNVMVSMVRSFLHMLKKVVKTMKCPQLGEEAAGVMAKINCIKSMSAMVGASKLVACCEASMKDQTPRTAQSIATLAETMQDDVNPTCALCKPVYTLPAPCTSQSTPYLRPAPYLYPAPYPCLLL